MTNTAFNKTDYTLLEEQTAYQGFFSLDQLQLKHRLFAGGWTPSIKRELFKRGQAVGLLSYDPWLDQVVMVEQFRVGALQDPTSPWLLEVIAGMIEAGEEAGGVAYRETQEEAGLTLLHLEHLYTYYSSPGGSDEQILLYLGIVDSTQVEQDAICGLASENEDLRVKIFSREAALVEATQGRAANAMSIIALQWLAMNHLAIKAKWLEAK